MMRSAVTVSGRRFLAQPEVVCSNWRRLINTTPSKVDELMKSEKPGEKKTGWTTIYKFPYIGIISALNRTKWYQLGATVLGCPFAYAMEMTGEISPGTSLICAAVGISATVATTAFSRLSAGTVGFFYLNQDESVARFGYVDSNGKRQDVLSAVERVQSSGENRFYIRIAVKDEEDKSKTTKLQLFHSHGIISDVGKFNQVL